MIQIKTGKAIQNDKSTQIEYKRTPNNPASQNPNTPAAFLTPNTRQLPKKTYQIPEKQCNTEKKTPKLAIRKPQQFISYQDTQTIKTYAPINNIIQTPPSAKPHTLTPALPSKDQSLH